MGDLVLTETEYNPVIARLDEEPRLFLMHIWANDDAVRLARGLRAALDLTNSARS